MRLIKAGFARRLLRPTKDMGQNQKQGLTAVQKMRQEMQNNYRMEENFTRNQEKRWADIEKLMQEAKKTVKKQTVQVSKEEMLKRYEVPQELMNLKREDIKHFSGKEVIPASVNTVNPLLQKRVIAQQLFLDELQKKAKKEGWKPNEGSSTIQTVGLPPVMGLNSEVQEIIRRQKLQQALTRGDSIQQMQNYQWEVSRREVLQKMYPPQMLKQVENKREKQLSQFKQLIEDDSQLHFKGERRRKNQKNKQLQYTDLVQSNTMRQIKAAQPYPDQIIAEKAQSTEMIEYEDLQFHKKKAIKQFQTRQNPQSKDEQLKRVLSLNLEQGNKTSKVLFDQKLQPEQALLRKKEEFKESTFGLRKQWQDNYKDALEGMDYEEEMVTQMGRKMLFQEKKYREQHLLSAKRAVKRERKKEMDKQVKALHQQLLREDLNFNQQSQKYFSKRQLLNSDDPEQVKRGIQLLRQKRQNTLLRRTPQEKQLDIYRSKTFTNVKGFLLKYLTEGLFNPHGKLRDYIVITEVLSNPAVTVLNVFWRLQQHCVEMNNPNLQKDTQKMLEKQSQYISGKMTQLLGLRYGPSVRFYHDKLTEETQKMQEDMGTQIREIAFTKLEQLQKQGKIKNKEEEEQMFKKLIKTAESNLRSMHNREFLLSRKYRKMEKLEKSRSKEGKNNEKVKQNQTKREMNTNGKYKNYLKEVVKQEKKEQQVPEGRKVRKSAVDKFWDRVDLL